MKKIVAILLLSVTMALAQTAGSAAAADASANGTTNSVRTPMIVGGALAFGSGTGVGTDRGIGLRQIEPMVGIWYPAVGFLRAGYGFSDYQEEDDDEDKYEVEHTDLNLELGVHILGEVYVKGSYSRIKELSDLGDVAWNEWGAGFGSLVNFFARTMLFAEVEYRWVRNHYDPFLKKNVNGSRLQFNIGFAAYVY